MKPKTPLQPTKRYIVKTCEGRMVANGVSHTEEEIAQMKKAGYRVREVTK